MNMPARLFNLRLPDARRQLGRHLVLTIVLVCVGCSGESDSKAIGAKSSPAAAGPQISASPNPVPAGPEKFGKTTVTWNTGDNATAEIYVSVNGADEKKFAGPRPKGSQEAAWIGKGEYEFRLYAGEEHKTVLASVKVTRATGN